MTSSLLESFTPSVPPEEAVVRREFARVARPADRERQEGRRAASSRPAGACFKNTNRYVRAVRGGACVESSCLTLDSCARLAT